ncbi:MAG TPA: putative glycolipid-binding domain-containing protein [Jiangellaceae bacterium]|nr:putative glycolipid-binding domain-containing protein [Jiangellaceae bacterium]
MAKQWPGMEHTKVRANEQGVWADGALIAVVDEQPVRVNYRIECDPSWRPVSVTVELHGQPALSLRRSASRWYDGDGQERPDLDGCLDVDIALTPFTNTIPIRRLALDVGDSADLNIVYIHPVTAVDVSAQRQTYTRTETGWRYESGSFRADLLVDADGVVLDYSGLWSLASR